jgi:hypothetical protein
MHSMQCRCLVTGILLAYAENKRADERTRIAYTRSSYEKESAGFGVFLVVAQVVCPSPSIYGMG